MSSNTDTSLMKEMFVKYLRRELERIAKEEYDRAIETAQKAVEKRCRQATAQLAVNLVSHMNYRMLQSELQLSVNLKDFEKALHEEKKSSAIPGS